MLQNKLTITKMEDEVITSAINAFHMLEPEPPSFSYTETSLDYQVPDSFNPSNLSGTLLTTTYPSDDGRSAPTPTTTAAPLDFP
ncbi:hypothetical protein O988_09449, partial [Pseudogymnoascus sp. VKM F-3808]